MWPFGRKYKPLDYQTAAPFTDGTLLDAPLNNRVPMDSFLGWTGQLVQQSLNAVNPAIMIPQSSSVMTSVYGAGFYPTDLPVQQMLSQKPSSGNL